MPHLQLLNSTRSLKSSGVWDFAWTERWAISEDLNPVEMTRQNTSHRPTNICNQIHFWHRLIQTTDYILYQTFHTKGNHDYEHCTVRHTCPEKFTEGSAGGCSKRAPQPYMRVFRMLISGPPAASLHSCWRPHAVKLHTMRPINKPAHNSSTTQI